MTHAVWRIASDTPTYVADDLTGAGARNSGGRWNRPGVAVVYCASSIALAYLETIVHFRSEGLPLNRYLVRVDIPDDVWARAVEITYTSAPVGWDALPEGKVSLDYGDDWVASGATALLRVPSVVVPEEQNVLINPSHSDAVMISAAKLRRWSYDPRVLKPG